MWMHTNINIEYFNSSLGIFEMDKFRFLELLFSTANLQDKLFNSYVFFKIEY